MGLKKAFRCLHHLLDPRGNLVVQAESSRLSATISSQTPLYKPTHQNACQVQCHESFSFLCISFSFSFFPTSSSSFHLSPYPPGVDGDQVILFKKVPAPKLTLCPLLLLVSHQLERSRPVERPSCSRGSRACSVSSWGRSLRSRRALASARLGAAAAEDPVPGKRRSAQ